MNQLPCMFFWHLQKKAEQVKLNEYNTRTFVKTKQNEQEKKKRRRTATALEWQRRGVRFASYFKIGTKAASDNIFSIWIHTYFWRAWAVWDIPDSHRRRRPQLHAACLMCLSIISLAQTISVSSCRGRFTGRACVGVSAAPDGPIRKPQTQMKTSEDPESIHSGALIITIVADQ